MGYIIIYIFIAIVLVFYVNGLFLFQVEEEKVKDKHDKPLQIVQKENS